MSLTKTHRALQEHLIRKNHELRMDVPSPLRTRESAPMPDEPGICRWCRGKLRVLIDGEPADYCERGCAANDKEPYLCHCYECGWDFKTGKHAARLCHRCEVNERHRTESQAEHERGQIPRYQFERFKRGGYR